MALKSLQEVSGTQESWIHEKGGIENYPRLSVMKVARLQDHEEGG